MAQEDVVKKMIDVVWNKHNTQTLQDFYHPQVMVHGPHGEIVGLENVKRFISDLFVSFPDLNYKVLEVFSSGNRVVVRWQGTGTHKGVFLGNASTNKKITYEGISIYQIENNKIREYWVSADLYGLFKQLGLLHISTGGH